MGKTHRSQKEFTRMQPSVKTVPIQKSGLDLETMADVILVKEVPAVEPVTSITDFQGRFGGDEATTSKAIFEALTAAIQNKVNQSARDTADGWLDKESGDPFEGSLAHPDVLNPLKRAMYPVAESMLGVAGGSKKKSEAVQQAVLKLVLGNPQTLEFVKLRSAEKYAKGE
jgi:hypothetical protein